MFEISIDYRILERMFFVKVLHKFLAVGAASALLVGCSPTPKEEIVTSYKQLTELESLQNKSSLKVTVEAEESPMLQPFIDAVNATTFDVDYKLDKSKEKEEVNIQLSTKLNGMDIAFDLPMLLEKEFIYVKAETITSLMSLLSQGAALETGDLNNKVFQINATGAMGTETIETEALKGDMLKITKDIIASLPDERFSENDGTISFELTSDEVWSFLERSIRAIDAASGEANSEEKLKELKELISLGETKYEVDIDSGKVLSEKILLNLATVSNDLAGIPALELELEIYSEYLKHNEEIDFNFLFEKEDVLPIEQLNNLLPFPLLEEDVEAETLTNQ